MPSPRSATTRSECLQEMDSQARSQEGGACPTTGGSQGKHQGKSGGLGRRGGRQACGFCRKKLGGAAATGAGLAGVNSFSCFWGRGAAPHCWDLVLSD